MHRPPKLKNLSLLQTIVGTWAMLTEGTEWLIAIQLVGEHGSGQKNYFSTSWTILSSGSNHIDHRKVCLILIQNLLEMN
jgi:hypothetical protein